ncbi:MAG: hypothetical protein ACI4RU_05525 [Acutalibacteraceae bacterium]
MGEDKISKKYSERVAPSVSKLTAPSEKEPDNALSVSLCSTAPSMRTNDYTSLGFLEGIPFLLFGRIYFSLLILRTAFPKGEARKKLLPRHLGEDKISKKSSLRVAPSVSKLTAPSEKEPDNALSVSLCSTAPSMRTNDYTSLGFLEGIPFLLFGRLGFSISVLRAAFQRESREDIFLSNISYPQ